MFGLRQLIELDVQHLLERFGHTGLDPFSGRREHPRVALANNDPSIHQVSDNGCDEQRIAARVPMNQPCKIGREAGVAELKREVFGYFGWLKCLERDLFAKLVDDEVLMQTAQVALESGDWRSPGHEQQQPGWPPTPSERGHDVERRAVGPVQVLEDQHERVIHRDRFERFADLPHHPLARRPEDLSLQRFALIHLDERRKLYQPGRRPQCQRPGETTLVGRADQLADGLEQRVIRFLTSESLEALAPRNPHIRQPAGLLQEEVDERRLADAFAAGHEYDLALAASHPLEAILELAACLPSIHDRPRGSHAVRNRHSVLVGDRRDKLVAASRERADEHRLVMPVTQHLTDAQDVFLDDLLVHEGVGPQRFEDFLLCDEAVGMIDEIPQQIERLRSQRHALVSTPQTVVGRVQPERVEVLHRDDQLFYSLMPPATGHENGTATPPLRHASISRASIE